MLAALKVLGAITAIGVSSAAMGEGVALIVPDFHKFAIDGNLDGVFDHFEQWGLPGDVVLAGQPYGPYRDGRSDLVVVRSREDWGAGWYVKSQDYTRGFSGRFVRKYSPDYTADSRPFLADFNGDGVEEAASMYLGQWTSLYVRVDRDGDMAWSSADARAFVNGITRPSGRDRVLAGRVGIPVDEMLIWRDATGNWEFYSSDLGLPTPNRFLTVQFGLPGDIPVAADANNDGFDDIIVFRPSNNTLYINYREAGAAMNGYGPNGDVDRTINYTTAIRNANSAHGLSLTRIWNLGATGIRW